MHINKQKFYEDFSEQYWLQNSHKTLDAENVMFMISTVFFLMADAKLPSKNRNGISELQYLDYVGNQGHNFVSISEAKVYYKEIKECNFLPSSAMMIVGIDGMDHHTKNLYFLRKKVKALPRSTAGDLFFHSKIPVKKLQLKKLKVTEKEMCLDIKEKKLCWYKKGKTDKHSLSLKQIINVEIGITPMFRKYMNEPVFEDLIQNPNLCLSVVTESRSFDFYGVKEDYMKRWYDKLSNIAEENTCRFRFKLPWVEPTLHEPEYDQLKQEIWDNQIFPNLSQYYSTHGSIQPLPYKKIEVKYETYKVDGKGKNSYLCLFEIFFIGRLKDKSITRTKDFSFPEFVMHGIPILARNLIYPMIIKHHYNENYYDILERKFGLKIQKPKFKSKLKKYKKVIKQVLESYERELRDLQPEDDELKQRVLKMLVILFNIERTELFFNGVDTVRICLHFVSHIYSDYECYKCFAGFIINNQFLMNNLQKKPIEDSEMFSTIEMNTIGIKEVCGKTVSDSDTYFVYDRLKNEFHDWGLHVETNLAKCGLKLKDYINSLRLSFLTSELPMSITSLMIDNYVVEGEYSLVKFILAFLKLKWSNVSRVADSSDITSSMLYKSVKELNLHKSEKVEQYIELKKSYKEKIDKTRLLLRHQVI